MASPRCGLLLRVTPAVSEKNHSTARPVILAITTRRDGATRLMPFSIFLDLLEGYVEGISELGFGLVPMRCELRGFSDRH